MIIEKRTYTLHPGKVAPFLELVRDRGLAIQAPHLGEPLGYFTSESGALNQVVHLWGFADAGDRERRRGALARDPAWQAFLPSVLPLIREMDSQILIPTAFSAIGGSDPKEVRP